MKEITIKRKLKQTFDFLVTLRSTKPHKLTTLALFKSVLGWIQ